MINFWDERYYVVVIFPLQKMTKMGWNSDSGHLAEITETAQNPENTAEQSWENYRIRPHNFQTLQTGPCANWYRSDLFLLIFWPFWHQFGPKLKPNHWPNFHLILIEELGLENLSFGGWVLPKTLVPSIPFILFSSLLIPFLQSSTFLPLPCLNKVPPCSWSWWEVAWAMVLQRGVPIPFLSLYIFDCLGLG